MGAGSWIALGSMFDSVDWSSDWRKFFVGLFDAEFEGVGVGNGLAKMVNHLAITLDSECVGGELVSAAGRNWEGLDTVVWIGGGVGIDDRAAADGEPAVVEGLDGEVGLEVSGDAGDDPGCWELSFFSRLCFSRSCVEE